MFLRVSAKHDPVAPWAEYVINTESIAIMFPKAQNHAGAMFPIQVGGDTIFVDEGSYRDIVHAISRVP